MLRLLVLPALLVASIAACISTAGRPRTGSLVMLASVGLGGVALQDVEAIVLDDSALAITLIGMSFLNGVDMRCAGNTLTPSRRQF
jgi:predicted aspartyl protease